MSEIEKARPRTKTELRRGAERTAPKPSPSVTADEQAFLLADEAIPTPSIAEIEPEPPQNA